MLDEDIYKIPGNNTFTKMKHKKLDYMLQPVLSFVLQNNVEKKKKTNVNKCKLHTCVNTVNVFSFVLCKYSSLKNFFKKMQSHSSHLWHSSNASNCPSKRRQTVVADCVYTTEINTQ